MADFSSFNGYNVKDAKARGDIENIQGNIDSLGELAFQDTASGEYTPQGTISQPTFTGDANTVTMNKTTAAVSRVTSVGTLSSLSYDSSTETITFLAGTLPTAEDVTVLADVSGTATATGTVSQPTFAGTAAVITVGAGEEPDVSDWYVYDTNNTRAIGLTAKLMTSGDPASITFDSSYGWGQTAYTFPAEVTDIDKFVFSLYYDKGGSSSISGIGAAAPNNSCSIYFHDNMAFSRTGSDALISGYPPVSKLRLPNSFTGLNDGGNVYPIFGGTPNGIICNDFTEMVIPPNVVAITSDNFGSGSFGAMVFPNFKVLKIMRKDSDTPLNFVDLSFCGTAMWNSSSIAEDFEIYFDFDESELSSKISFYSSAPDTDLSSFKGVFNYLKNNGRVHFNQIITNE